eukprot:GSMAST32.ASY1.ANO1.274.1 assembled CDS
MECPLPPLKFDSQPMSVSFAPNKDLVAASLITGEVKVCSYSSESCKEQLSFNQHTGACRSLAYSDDGSIIFTGSSDCSVAATDASTGKCVWRKEKAHDSAINIVFSLPENHQNTLATGDENGCVKIWDNRTRECTHTSTISTDYISDMCYGAAAKNQLLYTSGDGCLSVFNLKKGKVEYRSDDQEDELLSLQLIKNGKKVVCGTQGGVLVIFSYGDWSDRSDGFPGHPQSIEALLKIDEDTLITGSSDGIIRAVSVQPNRLIGVVGAHDDFPVEQLEFSRDQRTIASCSHDNIIKLWDVSMFFDKESDEEDDTIVASTEVVNKSADSDFDSDSDSDAGVGKGRKRMMKKKLKPKDAKKLRPNSMAGFFADL